MDANSLALDSHCHIYASFSEHFLKFTIADAIFTIPTNSPKNDFTLKVPTMEGIHLLYLEINKIFSLSCQPICNSAGFFDSLNLEIIRSDFVTMFFTMGGRYQVKMLKPLYIRYLSFYMNQI